MSASLVLLLALVAVAILGFGAARWGGRDLAGIEEWALGGRRFGTVVAWFLIGGDVYTAYTLIAVPALAYSTGAYAFFTLPYTLVIYPLALVILGPFWSLARERGYVTVADFVRDRTNNRALELAVAVTGVLAVLPYIALQVVGMKVVFLQLGGTLARHDGTPALAAAFLLLAAYTYTSGLRAPALIAFVKDGLIYVTVIAAVVVVTQRLGGWGAIMASVGHAFAQRARPASVLLRPGDQFAFVTAAVGSALALFLYPHAITSLLSARSRGVVERNMALLPIYTVLLGMIALLGYAAVALGIHVTNAAAVIPALFERIFPGWLAGLGYAAIVIGALVPAAIMAIGGANLCASNVFAQFSAARRHGTSRVAKRTAIAICAFALLFVLDIAPRDAIDFQFLGGTWILQTLPAFVLSLYRPQTDPRALLAGWAVGMACGTAMAFGSGFANYALHLFGRTFIGFVPLYALVANLLALLLAGAVLRVFPPTTGRDATAEA